MTKTFDTVRGIFDAAAEIRDRLTAAGASDSAKELSSTIEGFWTTSSEALVEMLDSFGRVRPVCAKLLSAKDLSLLDTATNAALKLLNHGGGPAAS